MPGLDAEMAEYEKMLEEEPEVGEQELAAMAGRAEQVSANDASPRPLYVSRKVKNVADLQKWATAQGLGQLQDDLHVTIAYSTKPVDWIAMGQTWQDELEIAEGGPRVVEPLGDRTAVLMFASSDLSWRNREMREAGASLYLSLIHI